MVNFELKDKIIKGNSLKTSCPSLVSSLKTHYRYFFHLFLSNQLDSRDYSPDHKSQLVYPGLCNKKVLNY